MRRLTRPERLLAEDALQALAREYERQAYRYAKQGAAGFAAECSEKAAEAQDLAKVFA